VIRPTPDELISAEGRSIPEVIGPDARYLFVGINPGLWSGATGHHFARPGNRFWPTLHGAGFTPRLLAPDDEAALVALRIGITNLVNRTTAKASQVTDDELRAGAARLRDTVESHRPAAVAVLGVSAYRIAFDDPGATIGRVAEPLAGADVWILPNPSGLNAHYQLPQLIDLFRTFRDGVVASAAAGAAIVAE
jgi:TDG/mug DNA glycosylase family protein